MFNGIKIFRKNMKGRAGHSMIKWQTINTGKKRERKNALKLEEKNYRKNPQILELKLLTPFSRVYLDNHKPCRRMEIRPYATNSSQHNQFKSKKYIKIR